MNEVNTIQETFSFSQIIHMVLGALMAALMAVGAFIAIPIGPVPIVLQNMFVMLAGLVLGPWWGLASVGIYLLAGVVGLPVFSGGGAGLGHLLGPTGGYLVAYLPAVFLIGLISRLGKKSWTSVTPKAVGIGAFLDVLAMIVGAAVIYALGVSWLKVVTGIAWQKALAGGMLPFLVGDVVKIAAAATIASGARRLLSMFVEDDRHV